MTIITNCHETLNRLWEFQRIIGIIGIILSRTSYDRSFYDRSFVLYIVRTSFVRSLVLTNTIARVYDRSCTAYDRSCLRSLVRTIARAYDRSCVRSLWSLVRTYDRLLTIARAYDRSWSCLRSLVLTIARAYGHSLVRTIARANDRSDRSCLRSLVLTIARAYDRSCLRSLVRTIVQLHAIDDRSIVLSIPLFDTTLVFVNTFNDVYSVVVLTVCTMKCILSLNTPLKHAPNLPLAGLTHGEVFL